ncbi:MAG: hypothetical protein RL199_1957 [Pseudomonadota bacterium]|jgi:hypothetical protein
MNLKALLVASATALACGPASVDGTVAGVSIDDSDTIASRGSLLGVDVLHVVVGGDTTALCTDFAAGALHAKASLLELSVLARGLGARTYAVGATGDIVGAKVTKLDAACGRAMTKEATSGSVTLTKVDGETVEGRFTLRFDRDTLEGDFAAPLCATSELPDGKSCR